MAETLKVGTGEHKQMPEPVDDMPFDRREGNCMLLTIGDRQFLVPRNVVAEVLHHARMKFELDDASGLELMEWRGRDVPVVAHEHIGITDSPQPDEDTRVAVLHGLNNRQQLPFYSLKLSRGPRLVRVSDSDLEPLDTANLHPAELMRVRLEDAEVSIPDVDQLETTMLNYLLNI